MYSDEAVNLRKELFNIRLQIARIEKNHHLEGQEKQDALKRLEELKKIEEDILFTLRHQMYEDYTTQNRGGRS